MSKKVRYQEAFDRCERAQERFVELTNELDAHTTHLLEILGMVDRGLPLPDIREASNRGVALLVQLSESRTELEAAKSELQRVSAELLPEE